MPPTNRIADLTPTIAEWRQHLHRHPELQWQSVAEVLREPEESPAGN